ncbi:MAG: hypothetical protein SWK76_07260 [Actinomycetota bacterium]|nr:hypothetical protein [Actinomycetota bacterium]
MELQAVMDERTRAAWGFMRAAYKHGLLDELLELLGELITPDADMPTTKGSLEELISEKGWNPWPGSWMRPWQPPPRP